MFSVNNVVLEVSMINWTLFFNERAYNTMTGYFIVILYVAVEVCLCQITPAAHKQ